MTILVGNKKVSRQRTLILEHQIENVYFTEYFIYQIVHIYQRKGTSL